MEKFGSNRDGVSTGLDAPQSTGLETMTDESNRRKQRGRRSRRVQKAPGFRRLVLPLLWQNGLNSVAGGWRFVHAGVGQTIGALGASIDWFESWGRRSPLPTKRPFYRYRTLWLVLLLGGAGSLASVLWSIERGLPNTAEIKTFVREGTLTVKALDGTVLQQSGPVTRDRVQASKMPPCIAQAFLAAEDRRFYQHTGVDYKSVMRAVVANLRSHDVVEGGSTITQQLARMVFLNNDRSILRKVQEAMLAQKIDRELPKPEILERYLNLVYLGSEAYGVADAAWTFFGKSVEQLSLAETALIAGLPPAPSDYSPLESKEKALQRRNVVLERMAEEGFITEAEATNAKAEPLKLNPKTPKKLYSDTPYFTSYVQQELPKLIDKAEIARGGLTIETTLNYRWQKAAEKAIKDAINVDGPAEGFEQAALVAIDPSNGEIRAMVGGNDYYKKTQFNRATQAQRQPGSTFKPFVYTTAIAAGQSPYQSYLDERFSVDGYQPKNFGNKYRGWLSMRDALTNSVNVVAVKILLEVGFEPVINTAQRMGIQSKLQPTYALALGAYEVNVLEMVNAYGALASKGIANEHHAIRRIFNRKGELIYEAKPQRKQVLDKDTTAIMTWMMRNVVNEGTGRPAQLADRDVAGKTGTSEEARDLWFIGFIPQVVAGVWLGNDDNYPTSGSSGTAAAAWHQFMKVVTQNMPIEQFAELPTNLDTRKGSIKAKPIKNMRSRSLGADEPDSRDRRRSYSNDPPSYSGNSGGGGSNSDAGTGSSNRAPAYEPPPPVAEPPAPAAPPAGAPPPEPIVAPPAAPDPAPPAADPAPPPVPAPAPAVPPAR